MGLKSIPVSRTVKALAISAFVGTGRRLRWHRTWNGDRWCDWHEGRGY
jgi:hypothetical protein